MRIEAIVAEGDAVAVRVLSEGTNLGPLNGVVPPTGKRFESGHVKLPVGGQLGPG
jgi:predicted ester cyclase